MMPFKVMRWGTGAPAATVNLSPGSQVASPTPSSSWTCSPTTATVTGGTPTSYAWSCTGGYGGVWAIYSGQGTATAQARVTGVLDYETAACNLKCVVTVGGLPFSDTAYLQYTRESTDPPD